MNKEQYVTFEVAKLLKEKGFDWECNTYLYTINVYNYGVEPCRFQINDSKNSELASDKMTAPTQQMACRWLRKEKGIHILPEISEVKENPKYYCMIWKTSTLESFIIELFDSYEDAIEAALQYCLTNLI